MSQTKARDLSAGNCTRTTISGFVVSSVLAVAIISALFIVEDNAFLYDVYAQPNFSLSSSPEEFLQQAKESLSTLMKLRNQSTVNTSSSPFSYSNDSSLNGSSSIYEDSQTQQFATDVSGHYNNPNYGILDFVIPDGWYGSERQWSGDKSIALDIHPGTEAEFLDRLLAPPSSDNASNDVNDVIPTMTLEANDKEQLQMAQSFLSDIPSTSDIDTAAAASQCKSLETNSTATINGKIFNVATMECTYSSNDTQMGDSGVAELGFIMPTAATIEVLKRYEYESPDKEYSLQLTISKDVFHESQSVLENAIDTHKYTPVIDTAAKTLKLK